MTHTQYQLKRTAVRLFRPQLFPQLSKASRRYQQRAWLASIALLGDKWLLANPIERKQ